MQHTREWSVWIYQGHGQTEERSQDQVPVLEVEAAVPGARRRLCPNQPSAAGAEHTIHPFKVSSSVGFGIFTRLCNHYNHLILEQSHHPPKETPCHWQSLPLPLPQSLATTKLLSVSVGLSLQDISYK